MKTPRCELRGRVWLYPGENPWYFVTIPEKQAQDLVKEYVWPRRGFGAIPVEVTIGKTTWRTSIFPDKGGDYVLPIKKQVRMAEEIEDGVEVEFQIAVIL